jgi:hypothetical protein
MLAQTYSYLGQIGKSTTLLEKARDIVAGAKEPGRFMGGPSMSTRWWAFPKCGAASSRTA